MELIIQLISTVYNFLWGRSVHHSPAGRRLGGDLFTGAAADSPPAFTLPSEPGCCPSACSRKCCG